MGAVRDTGTHITPVSQSVGLQCATTALGPGNSLEVMRRELNHLFDTGFAWVSISFCSLLPWFDVTRLCHDVALASVLGNVT